MKPLLPTILAVCACGGAVAPVPMQALTVSLAGDGSGTVSAQGLACSGPVCTARYPRGTAVTLTATANANSVFGGWNGSSPDAPLRLVMTADATLTAQFWARQPITVTL